MILIGEMNLTLNKAKGEFYCPTCRQRQPYVHRRVKRFLTLYFVPVLPIATVNDHVRCDRCRQTFALSSIQRSAEFYERQQRLEFASDVRRVMVLMMLADGQVADVEVQVIRNVFRQLSGEEITDAEMQQDIQQATRAKVTAAHYARAVAVRRNQSEKEWILRGAFLVASATGALTPQRLELLKSLPESLDISEHRFREIIAQTA